jgi:tetratricopeptide (TPR) repeat protein
MNVLPLVNKGLALFQWKQDVEAAERCCNEALRTDPECEAAVATLAQLSLQQGKIDVAVRMFERHTELARNEPELINALTYQYVRTNRLIWQVQLTMTTPLSRCRHRTLSSSLSRTTPTWQDNFARWLVRWCRGPHEDISGRALLPHAWWTALHLAGEREKAAFGRSFSVISMSHAFNPTSHRSQQNGQIRSVVRPDFKLNAGRRGRETKMPGSALGPLTS